MADIVVVAEASIHTQRRIFLNMAHHKPMVGTPSTILNSSHNRTLGKASHRSQAQVRVWTHSSRR